MSYLLKKINKGNLADFLVNPYDNVADFYHLVLQKYSRGTSNDDLIVFNKIDNKIEVIGCVDYNKKEIVIKDKYLTFIKEVNGYTLKRFKDLQDITVDIILKKLEEMKTIRRDEVEASDRFKSAYIKNRSVLFKPMVYGLLGTTKCQYSYNDGAETDISHFLAASSNKELVDIYHGDLSEVNTFVNDVVYGHSFLSNFYVFPKLLQEAQDYVDKKVYDKRELKLIDLMEKINACDAKKFDAMVDKYGKMSLRREISFNGKFTASNTLGLEVDFEKIQVLKYNEKTIYQKDDG